MNTELLTIPKAAAQLGIPTSTLRRAVKLGLIAAYRPFNSRLRVRLSEVQSAISDMRVGDVR